MAHTCVSVLWRCQKLNRLLLLPMMSRVGGCAKLWGRCAMTSPNHPSGTDCLTEIMQNRQVYISKLAQGMLNETDVHVGTLCHRLPPLRTLINLIWSRLS